MKYFMLLLGFTFLSLSLAEHYTDKYDHLNEDDILTNKRLLVSYIKCILDQGRCTPEGREIKLHIKDGMQNGCEKCTDIQKQKSRKVVKHIREHEKMYWEEMKKKYDPDDIYKPTYEAFLNADS